MGTAARIVASRQASGFKRSGYEAATYQSSASDQEIIYASMNKRTMNRVHVELDRGMCTGPASVFANLAADECEVRLHERRPLKAYDTGELNKIQQGTYYCL
jgi:hypothetical protein